jgi:hypothetical protein
VIAGAAVWLVVRVRRRMASASMAREVQDRRDRTADEIIDEARRRARRDVDDLDRRSGLDIDR